MIDRFGRLIVDNGDGTWSCEGITVGQSTQERALATFNGLAPQGWVEPIIAEEE